MSQGTLSTTRIEAARLWTEMCLLIDRLFGAIERDDVLDESLDVIVELFGADRGLILLTQAEGISHVVSARKQRKPLGTVEQQSISRSIIHRAIRERHTIVWDPMGEQTDSESIMSLGIAKAFAAPLFGEARPGAVERPVTGVLYVDVRDRNKELGESHVAFFTAAAHLLARLLEEHSRLVTTREDLREARARSAGDIEAPSLEEILAPPSMLTIRSELESALFGTSPILILGESGTGKTLLAHAIARASGRKPIVRAVLGMSDDLNTITSELFGHERGAFSGAGTRRAGLVELAHGGTLVFDEVLNLTPHAQKLVLDFTQFGTYRPLGYDKAEPKRSVVRLIAATNGDLDEAMKEGRFREDLYYRLAAVTLRLPPLRGRRQDIPQLAEAHLRRIQPGCPLALSLDLRRALVDESLRWPGNVRQLDRIIERARERALTRAPDAKALTVAHLDPEEMSRMRATSSGSESSPPPAHTAHEKPIATWKALQEERARVLVLEQQLLERALDDADGIVSHAARALGIPRSTLVSRLEMLGLTRR